MSTADVVRDFPQEALTLLQATPQQFDKAFAALPPFGLRHLDPGALTAQVNQMAERGLRVLGVAVAEVAALPEAQPGFAFRFLGLVGLADPLRAEVPAAVAECRAAGIRVVMITGDYPATARAIAAQAGLQGDAVITGADLAAMSDAALAEAVQTATIFARIQPEQKLRIVNAFKAGGAVVAMTGDGVNDAPSLKAAHIGIPDSQKPTFSA